MQAFFEPQENPLVENITICDLLEFAVLSAPDQTALKLVDYDAPERNCEWTYSELKRETIQLANVLSASFKPGENLAIMAPNQSGWTFVQLACAYAGLTLVTLNPVLREKEIEFQLRQSCAAGLFLEAEFRGYPIADIVNRLRSKLPDLRKVMPMSEVAGLIASGEGKGNKDLARAKPEETALIVFTSGTTGKPKGVELTHKAVCNNAKLGASRYEIGSNKVWLNTLPLFHIGGAVTSTIGCLATQGMHLVLPAPLPDTILKLVDQEKVNWLPVVPTLVYAMKESPIFEKTDLSSLGFLLTGGTVVPPELVRMVNEEMGLDVQVMFGQTEAGGAMAKTFRSDNIAKISETVGTPYPCTTMKIQDVDTDTVAMVGQIGEIRIKSPFMMKGYFNNHEGTQSAFDKDGFLCTGDLGRMSEDGYLSITGRIKEMILRGGENIYAREVEDALMEHPAVSECAAIGIPDKKWGEEVAAAVRLTPGKEVSPQDLEDYMKDRLAPYKRPRKWKIVDDFPRTAMGKIQKFELKNIFK